MVVAEAQRDCGNAMMGCGVRNAEVEGRWWTIHGVGVGSTVPK